MTLTSLWDGGGGKKRKRVDGSGLDTPVVPQSAPPPSEATEPVEKLTVLAVRYDLEGSTFSGEGRVITVEFPSFFLVNTYVPNSGQTLDRLESRTTEW